MFGLNQGQSWTDVCGRLWLIQIVSGPDQNSTSMDSEIKAGPDHTPKKDPKKGGGPHKVVQKTSPDIKYLVGTLRKNIHTNTS
jgi:hypothetical protein